MPEDKEISVDWKYHSYDPLSRQVIVFGKSIIYDGEDSSESFFRAFLDFYRREISFYDQGEFLSKFSNSSGCSWRVNREDISFSDNFLVSEGRLINPLISDKTRDIFYVSGKKNLSEIFLLDNSVTDLNSILLKDFIYFYSDLLQNKENLLSKGDTNLINYLDSLKRTDKKNLSSGRDKELRKGLIDLLMKP